MFFSYVALREIVLNIISRKEREDFHKMRKELIIYFKISNV